MKLVHPDLQMRIECGENCVAIWVIESPTLLRKYLSGLCAQIRSQDGSFILSDQEKEIELNKKADMILNPFEVDVNDKRFLNRVYTELKELAYQEDYYLQTQSLISSVKAYFMELEQNASVSLKCGDFDLLQLLKALEISIDDCEEGVLGKLGQYLHVVSKLMKKKLVIFLNLSAYLEREEMEVLMREAFYLDLRILLIETREIVLEIPKKCYIIDKGGCGHFFRLPHLCSFYNLEG